MGEPEVVLKSRNFWKSQTQNPSNNMFGHWAFASTLKITDVFAIMILHFIVEFPS